MSSYRFCRTDDIGLLCEALNRCRAPYFPNEAPMSPAAFKRSIRDLQVWCSSCMVAFEGADPIGVLIGAKRASSTLIHNIAVHPEHVRKGHGRHLLASLASKLSILGPPRMVAEVPETLAAVRGLFASSGYVAEATLTDYVCGSGNVTQPEGRDSAMGDGSRNQKANRLLIPVTLDDVIANGLLGEDHQHTCWERSAETLKARKNDIAGFAIASDERIDAFVLYIERGSGDAEIVSLGSFANDCGAGVRELLSHLRQRGSTRIRLPKVHSNEYAVGELEASGLRPADRHVVYAAVARPA